MEASCSAADDITQPMGDPQEASTKAALDYLAGCACTPITASSGGISAQGLREQPLELRHAEAADGRAAELAGIVLTPVPRTSRQQSSL